MGCPDANQLQALADGTLPGDAREKIFAHTDGCGECRQVLAAVVRERGPTEEPHVASADTQWMPRAGSDGEERRSSALIARGTQIGRYEVETLLGSGGLGVVYAAADPELGRRVALKLLKAGPGDLSGEQVRLMREAQAMARVSHPNVVAVFDVGRWEDRVYVAMELVEGTHLRGWLAERPRRVGEIVDAFLAAGRGLQAAHAAGIVHRDFKPENVLVGRDGRVCVTDFGLARAATAGDAEDASAPPSVTPSSQPRTLLDTPLTRADVLIGTPAYMAPEQHLVEHVDARADQFAFAVALYEALHGARPFAGKDYASLRSAVVRGRLEPASDSAVPRPLRTIVERALRPAPGDRWPTMEALLHALGRDRTRLPRRAAALAFAVLAVVGTAAIGDWVVRSRLYAVARVSFGATRDQAARALAFQYETFTSLAELSALVPIMREVAAARDSADFGLGEASEDRAQLENLHASLRDADWRAWAPATRRGHLAVADAKGRLLYSTGNPPVFGGDVRALGAVADAFRTGSGAEMLRADDVRLSGSGLLPGGSRRGLVVVFARAAMLADVPQAAFIQIVDGRHFLSDVAPDGAVKKALVAADGACEGDLPPGLVAPGLPGEALVEISDGPQRWLVAQYPIPGLGPERPPLGGMRIARPADVGLAGLFPHARGVLWSAAAAALLTLLVCWRSIRAHAFSRRSAR